MTPSDTTKTPQQYEKENASAKRKRLIIVCVLLAFALFFLYMGAK